ncbi:MAG: CHAT domain-containing protein [Crocosphaera sp.]
MDAGLFRFYYYLRDLRFNTIPIIWLLIREVNLVNVLAGILYLRKSPNKFSKDEALRRTQLDCLNNHLPDCDNMNTTNPIDWAGFILYGN